ncbi:MAG TPA: TetR/AcrR family transcriptional regulator [Caulobacteraceae bacterium]|nr:TetR/AcrR family transcriptional regulator [Caulobacteraceae bacterium]
MPRSSKPTPAPPRPNKRALAKSQTRQKILASAKRLFAERGYEGATIRDIASAAGMSTGAVFASFTGKPELFGEIVLADRAASYEIMERVLADRMKRPDAPVEETLAEMLRAGYRFRLKDIALLQATISAAWSPDLGAEVRERLAKKPVTELIGRALEAGVKSGQLRANGDLPLMARLLWDAYLGNYAHAAYDGWKLDKLDQQMRSQIKIVLAGDRTGRAAK